mmetsp:Transcript_102798/g.329691  ORF Transcript_102798/g.329691 Transcript_102798/m.329691 type:complete len:354 (+) Transcript_102798:156-1217(+)
MLGTRCRSNSLSSPDLCQALDSARLCHRLLSARELRCCPNEVFAKSKYWPRGPERTNVTMEASATDGESSSPASVPDACSKEFQCLGDPFDFKLIATNVPNEQKHPTQGRTPRVGRKSDGCGTLRQGSKPGAPRETRLLMTWCARSKPGEYTMCRAQPHSSSSQVQAWPSEASAGSAFKPSSTASEASDAEAEAVKYLQESSSVVASDKTSSAVRQQTSSKGSEFASMSGTASASSAWISWTSSAGSGSGCAPEGSLLLFRRLLRGCVLPCSSSAVPSSAATPTPRSQSSKGAKTERPTPSLRGRPPTLLSRAWRSTEIVTSMKERTMTNKGTVLQSHMPTCSGGLPEKAVTG